MAHQPSISDSLPSIDFGFDDLRARMSAFTVKFDTFIDQGRRRIIEDQKAFKTSLAELAEDKRMRKKDIEILEVKQKNHAEVLLREEQERKEMEGAIEKLSREREEKEKERERLLQAIEETQRAIDDKIAMQRAHTAKLSKMAIHDVPELDFWQQNLGLRIEGAGKTDRLKFVFWNVDERDWEREAWFELKTETREYEIGGCYPKLERERVERVIEKLNETRELGGLLKGMRELFVEAMKA